MRLEGHNGAKLRIITIGFDLFAIFESDRGGHEARAFGEVEGDGQVDERCQ